MNGAAGDTIPRSVTGDSLLPTLMPMSTRLLALLFASIVFAGAASAQDRTLHLSVGDPARKDREAPLVLDAVTDTATGDLITPADLAGRLSGVRVLLLGEEHTSIEFHRVQARVIAALAASGRKLMIGLEMYPYTEQRYLDQWRDGLLTEDGFVQLSRWYENWGYHWNYYRDIFLFARDHHIPMVAANTPREVVAAVRKKGFQNLTPDEARHLPATGVDVDSADHMTFFKATLAGEAEGGAMGGMLHGGNDDMWKSMLNAQATWDATMGYNAVQALKQNPDPTTLMVVLVGSGHVAYGLGIERQVGKWFDGKVATLIPVPVRDSMTGDVKSVRASYANYIWGVPTEWDTLYPSLGLSFGSMPGGADRAVIDVQAGSIGKKAGFELGDALVSIDGTPVADREVYNRLIAAKRWGDSATFVVRRKGENVTLTAAFRRSPPRLAAPAPAESPAVKPPVKKAPAAPPKKK
jgi:uncharacterized iron-regulated protein